MIIKSKFSSEERGSENNINNECDNLNVVPYSDCEENRKLKINPDETKCGVSCFHPSWLQILSSKKMYVLVYALAGMEHLVISSYFVGTLSSIEKNFNMSSRMTGIISGAWDIGSLLGSVGLTYVAAKGHRTRWVAFGMFLSGFATLMKATPYFVFGPGEIIKTYTIEYGDIYYNSTGNITDGIRKMSTNINCGQESTNSDLVSFYIFLISNIVLGIGTALYWTCGATYLDDNARKDIIPTLLAIVQALRLFGPTIGFFAAAYALKIYIDPNLTPFINKEDPRWIGAWWLGWYPIGISCWITAGMLIFFPRTLPRQAIRMQEFSGITKDTKPKSFSDFKRSMGRILKNKILMYNSFSTVCFAMGVMAYYTFMPKYMESQYRLSASESNFLTGTIGLLANALGIITSGIYISALKPSPRFLAGWNVFTEFLDVIGYVSFSWLGCPEQLYHGHWNIDHSWNLTESCNSMYKCGTDIQFAPVCDISSGLAYYSSCHAGCTTSAFINKTLVYSNCSCLPNMGSVTEGLCPTDCSKYIIIFLLIFGILCFTGATGRAANTLIQFRCVREEDKSLSIGVTESLLSILAFIPAPIFYGVIIDWACIVWGDNCGSPGNCWIYDGERLKMINFSAASFLLGGTILDIFVWYYAKGLKIYDQDFKAAQIMLN